MFSEFNAYSRDEDSVASQSNGTGKSEQFLYNNVEFTMNELSKRTETIPEPAPSRHDSINSVYGCNPNELNRSASQGPPSSHSSINSVYGLSPEDLTKPTSATLSRHSSANSMYGFSRVQLLDEGESRPTSHMSVNSVYGLGRPVT